MALSISATIPSGPADLLFFNNLIAFASSSIAKSGSVMLEGIFSRLSLMNVSISSFLLESEYSFSKNTVKFSASTDIKML